jgi:hypothetical protein
MFSVILFQFQSSFQFLSELKWRKQKLYLRKQNIQPSYICEPIEIQCPSSNMSERSVELRRGESTIALA